MFRFACAVGAILVAAAVGAASPKYVFLFIGDGQQAEHQAKSHFPIVLPRNTKPAPSARVRLLMEVGSGVEPL